MFTATGMRPGQRVTGTVRIGNGGDIAGRLGVRTVGVMDAPGPFGGQLSERLELVLFDVADDRRPLTLISGHPADFGEVDLGTFAAGEARDYLFTATLQNGGPAGDNAVEGSGVTLGFEWRAGAVAAPSSTPTPSPTATPIPRPFCGRR